MVVMRRAAIMVVLSRRVGVKAKITQDSSLNFQMLHKSQKRQRPALNRRKEKVRKELVKDALFANFLIRDFHAFLLFLRTSSKRVISKIVLCVTSDFGKIPGLALFVAIESSLEREA